MHMTELVRTIRIQRTYREIFMPPLRLIAIIRRSILWGLKTPAISLSFLQVNEEDDELVMCYWFIQIKKARVFCYSISVDFYIL